MKFLLRVSGWIDAANARLSVIATWLVLLSCVISAANAVSRYTISVSSNAWLEIQWYMFGAMIMLGAAYKASGAKKKRSQVFKVDFRVDPNAPRGVRSIPPYEFRK